jgi:N-acetylmuramoyl-L-alanine amidase
MRAVLIRKDDYFLKLRKRIELARDYRADLFVSIHADTYPGSDNAKGASVYMLSQAGASSEAANWLANKENAADLLGGVSLSDKDDLLASVLLDLSQTGTLEASARLGERIMKSLDKIGASHYTRVQQAAFMVLRSPDIPSILVETGFISTSGEEEKLNSTPYRKQIAVAVFEGIKSYFTTYTTETLIARQ